MTSKLFIQLSYPERTDSTLLSKNGLRIKICTECFRYLAVVYGDRSFQLSRNPSDRGQYMSIINTSLFLEGAGE